jgi:hypothetical protein
VLPARLTRRELLAALGAAVGAAAAADVARAGNALEVALAWEPSGNTGASDGRVFPQPLLALLRAVCAQVIPTTDTPGAHELDVHGFVDNQLFHCADAGSQAAAVTLLEDIDAAAVRACGAGFAAAGAEEQLAVLTSLEQARGGFDADHRLAFKHLKNLIVFGYLTTETGATRTLAIDPFPGGFDGSVPYASVGRAWLGNVT